MTSKKGLKFKILQRIILQAFCLILFTSLQAQTKKVLFIGNSYTGYNNLPQMVADAAASAKKKSRTTPLRNVSN